MSVALLGHAGPDATVAWVEGRPVSAGRFVADVVALADRLPPGRGALLNLCAQRYAFAVTVCAAAVLGRPCLLPPSGAPEVLRRTRAAWPAHDGVVTVTDDGASGDANAEANGEANVDATGGATGVRGPCVVVPGRPGAASRWPAPDVDPDAVVAVAFTSGTTGTPQPYPKTWRSMSASAAAEADALGLRGRPGGVALVATVPPHHMYGLETSVVLALRGGFAFDASRPLQPEDIAAALRRVDAERVLVTTPVHLRAMLGTDVHLPPLLRVVSATAPLAASLAREVEARWGAPLVEIYGCTETGQVASRRSAATDVWTPLAGVTIGARDDGACWAQGEPVARPAPLADALELRPDGGFRLLGRSGDQVDVGGKRASIAGLTASLLEIAGVRDAAFWQPPGRDPSDRGPERRLVAFAVAPGLDRDALLASLRGRIDPVFMPRPLVLVDALPRNAVGKLPAREFGEWAATTLAARATRDAVRSTHVVAPDDAMLAGHFPGDPIVPGAWILSLAQRRARHALPSLGLVGTVDRVVRAKFRRPVRPGEAMTLELRRVDPGTVSFTVRVDGLTAATGVLALTRA